MDKHEELSLAAQLVKESETALQSVSLNLDYLDREVDFLLILQKHILDNISVLKRDRIVTLVIEYRKAKEELVKTKARLKQMRSDRQSYESIYKDVKETLRKRTAAYETLLKKSENNVLQGSFGKKKHGQK